MRISEQLTNQAVTKQDKKKALELIICSAPTGAGVLSHSSFVGFAPHAPTVIKIKPLRDKFANCIFIFFPFSQNKNEIAGFACQQSHFIQ